MNTNEYMKTYLLKRYHERMTEIRKRLGGKCCKCGGMDNLEIDHIDPSLKWKTVSQIWNYSKEKLEQELGKCQLLCQSCHNLKTLNDKGLKVAKGNHGTISTYRYCKCKECRKAKSEHSKQYRLKKLGIVSERPKGSDF